MKYFKPGMIVPYPFESDYYVIILKVLKEQYFRPGYSLEFCLVLTDEGLVKEIWLHEDLNKQLV